MTRLYVGNRLLPDASLFCGPGWFGKLHVRPDKEASCEELFNMLREKQREWQVSSYTGPVSVTACSFGEGALTYGFDSAKRSLLQPECSPIISRVCLANGGRVTRKMVGATLAVAPFIEKYAILGAWVEKRSHLHPEIECACGHSASVIAQILGESEDAVLLSLARAAEQCPVFVDYVPGKAFILMLVRGRRARIATGWSTEMGSITPIALHAARFLAKRGIKECDISTIDEDNISSLSIVKGVGGIVDKKYAIFSYFL